MICLTVLYKVFYFVGKPSTCLSNPDYVPSVFVFSRISHDKNQQRMQRYKRSMSRQRECGPADESEQPETDTEEMTAENPCTSDSISSMKDAGTQCFVKCVHTAMNTDDTEGLSLAETLKETTGSLKKEIKESKEEIEKLQQDCKYLRREIHNFKSPAAIMQGDNDQTRFYTGLPSFAVFASLSDLFSELISPGISGCGLSHSDQLLLVLMKLRLAIPNQDLAYRFKIHVTKVSKVFHTWIDIMARELNQFIVWPDRGCILENLPDCFKQKYMRTTCIIDCSEIFIERPSSLSARAETYSNYKSHNTVKFLIAISPTGAIIFVSKCWGGRVSDKHLTANSGFMDHLMYGDLVLADRGFDIADDLSLFGSSLAIPPFTKGKDQLSQSEVERARALSRVRIHVERAIGRLKLLYKILQSTLPITLIKRPHETDYATIDKILIVCCAICNLHPRLI